MAEILPSEEQTVTAGLSGGAALGWVIYDDGAARSSPRWPNRRLYSPSPGRGGEWVW